MKKPALKFPDAICIKSAELWLRLGQPYEAVREVRRISDISCQHRWAASVLRTTRRTRPGSP